jgi:hypothetical protein
MSTTALSEAMKPTPGDTNRLGGNHMLATTTKQGRRGKRPCRQGAKVSRSEKCTETEACRRCQENPRSVCTACTQRRRRAAQLRDEGGLSVEQIAARMRLALPRVERLLEEEDQYRDLQQFVCNSVPVAVLQDLICRAEREDPALTTTAIAQRAGYSSRLALQRAVGLEPTARRIRGSKQYPPKLETTVEVAIASKIVRALGFAPHEIPGL